MKMMLHDSAALGYMALFLLCIYGTALFSYGLWVARKQNWRISAMYLYILMMFFSLGYSKFFAIIARYLTDTDPALSYVFRQSLWWATRSWPIALVLLLIVAHMTFRAVFQKDFGVIAKGDK